MPLLVHVRDIGGGFYWGKNWRMAQLRWWDPRIDFPEDFGKLIQMVVNEEKARILHLEDISLENIPTVRTYILNWGKSHSR